MIRTKYMTINGKQFIRTHSDNGYMVERDGMRYPEAIDPAERNRQYTETDELIDSGDYTETEQKARAYDILTGVSE